MPLSQLPEKVWHVPGQCSAPQDPGALASKGEAPHALVLAPGSAHTALPWHPQPSRGSFGSGAHTLLCPILSPRVPLVGKCHFFKAKLYVSLRDLLL